MNRIDFSTVPSRYHPEEVEKFLRDCKDIQITIEFGPTEDEATAVARAIGVLQDLWERGELPEDGKLRVDADRFA